MTDLMPKEELARHEAARTAVVQARSLMRGWTTMARMMARNPRLRVELTGGSTSCTDGKTLFIKVPAELQEELVHDVNLCQKRDVYNVPACHACDILEQVNIHVIHEVSHVIYGTFEDVTDFEKAQLLERAIDSEAAGRPDSKRAAAIKRKIDMAPPEKKRDYLNLADLVSPWLPFLFNACEDIRVNTLMQNERPGTRKMFDGQMQKIFREGVLRPDGTRFHWRDASPNAQAAIGVFCKMGGYNWRESLSPEVVEKIDDPDLDALCQKMNESKTARDVYRLCYPLLEDLRRLGFMKVPDEPEDDPPPPPPEESDAPEEEAEDSEPEEESSGDDGGTPEDGGEDSPGPEGDSTDEDGGDSDDGGEGDSQSDPGSSDLGGGDDESSDEEGDSPDAEASEGSEDNGSGGDGSDAERASEAPDAEADADEGGTSEGTPDDNPSNGSSGDLGDSEEASGDSGSPGEDSSGSSDSGDPSGSSSGMGASEPEGSEGTAGEPEDAEEGSDPGSGSGLGNGGGSRSNSAEDSPLDPDGSDSEGTPDGHDTGQDCPGGPPDTDLAPSTGDGEAGPQNADKDTDQDSPEGGEPYSEADLAQDGTPEEVEHLFKLFGGHEKQVSTPSEAIEETLNTKAVEVALKQLDFFDSPSLKIEGVNEHHYKDDEPHRAFGYGRREVSTKTAVVPERLITGSLTELRLVFQDNARGRKESDLRRGKINSRRLAQRVPVGDDRVFKKNHQPGRKDYFVLVGIDCSGSTSAPYDTRTSGPRLDLMKMAVYAKAEMLSRLGVPFALYAHSGAARMLEMFCIKGDKEPWGRDQKAALMSLQPYSANLDGHTMEYYRKVCERRTETDKLILYYTDGAMPAANFDEELEILEREIRICKDLGIHLVGIGVNSDSPTEHGLDTILLDNLDDVPKVVKGLQERLT